LYVTTGYALVLALDAANGDEIWRSSVSSPIRSAPTASGGRVFAVTVDNKLQALDARDGKLLWSHSGLAEIAGMLGGASPAVQGDIVVVPYSSGELVALRVENGRRVWADSLVVVQGSDPVSTIADIRGRPVIDRDMVIAIGNGGRMAAIATRTGARVWQRALAGIEMPWVAGDFVFVVTTDGELLCLTRRDGRIRWSLSLPKWEDEDDRTDPINWAGPVLAGDRLVLGSSTGEVVAVSPYTGELLGRIEMPGPISIAPIVAGETLYFLTDDGDLVALR
ncbi:MAG: outer membrane protein assembly factor BamB family protein, partial [Alphaproteobacteria bacterium]